MNEHCRAQQMWTTSWLCTSKCGQAFCNNIYADTQISFLFRWVRVNNIFRAGLKYNCQLWGLQNTIICKPTWIYEQFLGKAWSCLSWAINANGWALCRSRGGVSASLLCTLEVQPRKGDKRYRNFMSNPLTPWQGHALITVSQTDPAQSLSEGGNKIFTSDRF